MCRNIKTLFNFEPPATEEEVRASALQFVRKLSGYTFPSKANEEVFNRAVDEVAAVAQRLLSALETNAPPRDREVEVGHDFLRFGLARSGAQGVTGKISVVSPLPIRVITLRGFAEKAFAGARMARSAVARTIGSSAGTSVRPG